MKTLLASAFSALIAGLITSHAALPTAPIFSDDFESGNLSQWTLTATSPLDISTVQNIIPAGGQFSALVNNSLDRMHRNIIADNGGVEVDGHSAMTCWIYDAAGTTASRVFCEVRGHAGGTGLPNGGTTLSGTLAQLLAIGKYNSVTLPAEVFNGAKYQARVTFGTSAGWFNLNAAGSPNRSTGWHRFDIERLADGTTINFYVDGILSRTITGATAATWDTAILGPGLGSTVGDAWIDGFAVTIPGLPIIPGGIFGSASFPPTNGVYISAQGSQVSYAIGIIVRNFSQRFFTPSMPPPPAGGSQLHNFDSRVEFEYSIDGGATFHSGSANGSTVVDMRSTSSGGPGSEQTFDTEMLQLNIAGGTLPAGVMLRESPTRASTGRTTIRQVPSGDYITSFFDVFTEISLDGGQTWSPAQTPAHLEVRVDPTSIPPIPAPTPLLPPPNDLYVTPAQVPVTFPQGAIIRNIRHQFFTRSLPPPPPGGNQTHQFDSTIDMHVSLDGGQSFRPMRVPAATDVRVTHRMTAADGTQSFDTEMLALNLQGGDLPQGTMMRESPTKQSLGGTAIFQQVDGRVSIHSFFDVFTELSMDGGQTWRPADAPVRVELICLAPENPYPSPNLPPADGEYVNLDEFFAAYAAGIIIKDFRHSRFTESQPPPPPGGTQVHAFGSQVSFMISMDGGQTFSPGSSPAQASFRVTSSVDNANTRFFDTEMLSLNLQGGSLPPGVMIRESPSRASLGRTSIRMVNDPTSGIWDYISSFFDVFTELSTNGGQTWSPSVLAPVKVALRLTPTGPPPVIHCPGDLKAWTCSPNGGPVDYLVTATGTCGTAVSITCLPPSGSNFPLGSTTVNCVARDQCGQSACSFVVTMVQDTERPRVICPQDIELRTCRDRERVAYRVTAVDDCDTNVTVVCTPPSNSAFPVGTTVVTCVATDDCMHESECKFQVIITQEPTPKLSIRYLSNGKIIICWPAPSTGYRLQCTRELIKPISWSEVLSPVQQIGGLNCVTLDTPGRHQFYRLICDGVPVITEVIPAQAKSGDVIRIRGTGFGNNPNNLCAVVVEDGGSPGGGTDRWIPLRVLSASDTDITARLGPVPPDVKPGPIMIGHGVGQAGRFRPAFFDIFVADDVWTWQKAGPAGMGQQIFQPQPAEPTTEQFCFYSGPPTNGELCVFLQGNWPSNATVSIVARAHDSVSGAGGYDLDGPTIRLLGGGTTAECAERIADIIRCAFAQQAGVTIEVTVTPMPDGRVKITVRIPNGRIDRGMLTICVSGIRAPVITEVIPAQAQSGAVIRILGSGFGNNPDNLCCVAVAGNQFVPLRVLSSTGNELQARLGEVPPNLGTAPLPIMVGVGQGNVGRFRPAFFDIFVEEEVWTWHGVGPAGMGPANFVPRPAQPTPNRRCFHNEPITNGVICVYLDGNWPANATVSITARAHDSITGAGGNDLDGPAIRFLGEGTTLDCALRIADTIRCAFQQQAGVTVEVHVMETPDGRIKLTVKIQGGYIDRGMLVICVTGGPG